MNVENQQFNSFVKAESKYFSSILDVMYHTQKETGRNFLNMMNNIVDYALNDHVKSDTINYKIIHIHSCPDWARELLVRFLIHKIALTKDQTTINRFTKSIQPIITIGEGKEGRKEASMIRERNKYFRKLLKLFKDAETPTNKQKSFLITKEQDLITKKSDKNPWIYELFTKEITDDKYNLILSTDTTAFDIEKTIKGLDEEGIPVIENIFIFHSPNKGKITNSYNKNQLERLNRHGLGIKNCIIFSLSDQPFRLYQTIDNVKCRLASSLLNRTINKYDEFEDFITFTQEEIDFLFRREINQEILFIDCNERLFFTSEIDQLIDQLPHNLRYKNNLALAFTDKLQCSITQSIAKEIKDFPIKLFDDYFNLLEQLWTNQLKDRIEAFIEGSHIVGFILPNNMTSDIKHSVSLLFQKPNRTIKYYSLEDIRKGVKVDKLVVLQYRYTDKIYKSYPNSFDPLPLRNNQKALIVINRLTHNNYYEWNIYWYDKDKNGLLFSNFRKEILGWTKKTVLRPTLPAIVDYINEAENEARKYQTEKCRVYYKENSKEYLACERVLYKKNDALHISELKDIADFDNLSIQFLDDIIEQVKDLISEKSADRTNSEAFLRKDPKFALTETEIKSSVELWKILLKRKVANVGEQTVYNAIFSAMPPNERISISTFNQWYNTDNVMILPRSRKHQKALLRYLGFELGSAYHRIIIAKKLSNINNSRLLNSQIETLLRKALVNKIDEKNFRLLLESHSDIFTLLSINDIEDVNVLVSLLEISLTPIERIGYDQD